MLHIDEKDIKNIKSQIIMRVSEQLGITFTTTNETCRKIKNMNQELYNKMEAFIKAYEDWFVFHKSIDDLDKQGSLNPDEMNEMNKIITNRDDTRKKLIKIIDKLQT